MDVETTHRTNGLTNGVSNGHSEATNGDRKMPSATGDQHPEFTAQILAMSPEEYAAAEKKLLRKMDLNIIPWIT